MSDAAGTTDYASREFELAVLSIDAQQGRLTWWVVTRGREVLADMGSPLSDQEVIDLRERIAADKEAEGWEFTNAEGHDYHFRRSLKD